MSSLTFEKAFDITFWAFFGEIIVWLMMYTLLGFTKKHEIAHAKAALRNGLDAVLVLKNGFKKNEKIVIDGITVYMIKNSAFYKKFSPLTGGFCSFEGEDNPKTNKKARQEINVAGPDSDKKVFGGIAFYFFALVSVLNIGITFCVLVPFLDIYALIPAVLSGGFGFAMYILQMYCNRIDMHGSLKRAFKKVKRAEPGSVVKYTISDGTKMHHPEEYQKLLEMIAEKGLRTTDSHEEIVSWAEDLVK